MIKPHIFRRTARPQAVRLPAAAFRLARIPCAHPEMLQRHLAGLDDHPAADERDAGLGRGLARDENLCLLDFDSLLPQVDDTPDFEDDDARSHLP